MEAYDAIEQFRDKVETKFNQHGRGEPDVNGCIVWTGRCYGGGRPMMRVTLLGRVNEFSATRVAYVLSGKPLTANSWVLHSCDHPKCVNPDHLRAGTPKENMADTLQRGGPPNAKVTEDQARAIHKAPGKYREIAAEYGITAAAVSHIKSGRAWQRLGLPPMVRRQTSTQSSTIKDSLDAMLYCVATYDCYDEFAEALESVNPKS